MSRWVIQSSTGSLPVDFPAAFFGKPWLMINPMIRVMASFGTDGPAEWLRGTSSILHLPRFCRDDLPRVFKIDDHTWESMSEHIAWIVENTEGRWSLTPSTISFEDDEAALHYRLRFSSQIYGAVHRSAATSKVY